MNFTPTLHSKSFLLITGLVCGLTLSGCASGKKIVHTARMSDRSERPRETSKWWKAALGEQDDFVLKTLNQRFQAALERSGKLTFPKSEPVTMDIRFRDVFYGLRNRGKKQFSVVAEVQVVFVKGKEDEFFEFGEELESKTRATIPEYYQNPGLFQRAVTEIADKLGSLAAEEYELPEE